MNTPICVINVHNVSFTALEFKKSPEIVFYPLSQCNNISRDQLATGICTPFGFWNATSITFDRLGVFVYPQLETADCAYVFGIAFTNVFQVHLHHCNITVVYKTIHTNPFSFSLCNSIYLGDSESVTVAFSTIISYQGSLFLMKSKNIQIANSTIVGGIEVHESVIATISYCKVLLIVNRYVGTIIIRNSRNINVSGVFVHLHGRSNGISIKHTNRTRITNVTVLHSSYTGLDLWYNIDTQVLNTTILYSNTGISIYQSTNTALQDIVLWNNGDGIRVDYVVKVNINNIYATGSIRDVLSAYDSRSLTIKNLHAVNWTGHCFEFIKTTNVTLQNLTIKPGNAKKFPHGYKGRYNILE